MKVLFIIAAMGHGKGGHFHSLDHISQTIGAELPVAIVTIGPGKSDVLEGNIHFLRHIDFNGIRLFKLRKELRKVVSTFKPDVLHFFDSNSYNAIKPLIGGTGAKLVVNKCGGPNPIDFPIVENLVLFSEENRKWFLKRKKFQNINIFLIPNRAKGIVTLENPVIKKDFGSFSLMRIARIGTSYIRSIEESIFLLDYLMKTGHTKVKLYIVGTVQDKAIYEELLNRINHRDDIVLVTEDQYTSNASKMLYLADAVIATGRGIMEASSLGLPVLTPALNSEFPVLITSDNFSNFFQTNFSPRNIAGENDLKENMGLIERLITDAGFYRNTSKSSLKFFEENFDVDKAFPKYHEVYTTALSEDKKVSVFSDAVQKLRTFYHFHLNSRQSTHKNRTSKRDWEL